ncbi:MAG: hypothetical protein RL748_1122, partial [Pseudomonadota bacterium]
GLIPNGFSREAVISHDGQKVLFVSNAVNLQGINDREWHLYLKDVASGSLRLIDADANGAPKGVSQLGAYAHISADGSKVVYQNYNGIYLKDLQTGAWAPVLDQRNEILFGTIEGFSSDGRYLTFSSSIGYYAKYDLDGSGANNSDLFQKDLQTGEIRLLTPHGYRSSGTGGVTVLDVSNDGQSTLFSSVNPGVFGDEPAEKDLPGPTQVYLSHNGTASNGKDALIGSYGVDRLEGGYGDDSYWIDNLNDSIIEGAGGGTDSVLALVDKIVLPDNVENLKLSSVTASGDGRVLQGTGNAQNNYISGNFNNNLLRGLGGDDIINAAGAENYAGSGGDTVDGGDGTDSLIFNTNQADARLSKLADGWTIEKILGSSNKVTLLNMERIQFYDKVLALPGDTHAAQAYRIYQAAFNRAPDQSGLGFWVKQIDNGLKLTDIASGFIQSSEFTAAYGSAPSNLDLATKFYQNVLHRNPDAGGLNFWVDALNSHRATPEMVLAQFAESPENQAALAGVIDAGITFRLFQ